MPTKTDAKTGTAVAKPGNADLETADFKRFLEAAQGDVEERNPAEVTMEIIARIVNAKTIEEAFDSPGATHARDYLDTYFLLTDVRFNESTFDAGGPQFYGLLTGATDDGEKLVITCGAAQVIAQAWKLRDLGSLPARVRLVESDRPTKAGYKVMWLELEPTQF